MKIKGFCNCSWCQIARETGGKNIRTRTSTLINDDLLIDFGPDTFSHSFFHGLDLRKIKHLLITHSHHDHFTPAEIANIHPPMAESNKLRLYGNDVIIDTMERIIDRLKLTERLDLQRVYSGIQYAADSYQITPIKAVHNPNEDCLLYCISHGGKTILFAHDTAYFKEDAWELAGQHFYNAVIMDCTSLETTNYNDVHMGIADNVKMRSHMIDIGIADENTAFISTHFAHSFGPLHERISPLLSDVGLIAAYDGLTIQV
jgi:phosphoribosyl 1,2-cyclic phosphate phosphodiesterase